MEPIRRCKWCIARIGESRYFILGEWQTVPDERHFFGDAQFTDGICKSCFDRQMAELKEQSPQIKPQERQSAP
jgi:hypothetical protein